MQVTGTDPLFVFFVQIVETVDLLPEPRAEHRSIHVFSGVVVI